MGVEGLTWTLEDADGLTQAEIYGETLCRLGDKYPNLVALTADLAGSTKIGKFQKKYPERFFNVGIAEQNLFGLGAGLALAGKIPVISTFAVFASQRAAEQVRTDICYQNLNCKIIATHSGVSFGQAGTTHHCTEDLAIMRSFANMTVIVPADGLETAQAVAAALEKDGPVYIRIGRGFEPLLYKDTNYDFTIGKAIEHRPGTDLTIIACGVPTRSAVEASEYLENEDGVKVRVLDMHTIKPIDKEAIHKAIDETKRILTVEDHTVIGGLGGAVAEVIAEYGKSCIFRRIGLQDTFSIVGYPEDLYSKYEQDYAGIMKHAREMLKLEAQDDLDIDWDED